MCSYRSEIPKGEGLDTVLAWLSSQSGLIANIQFANESIQKDMAAMAMFHRSIWPRWKYWMDGCVGDEALRVAGTRHLVSHLYASLLEPSSNGVHSEEYYYVPSINSAILSTGDLLRRSDGIVEVVISPRCDIAHPDKSSTLQLAECENQTAEWDATAPERKRRRVGESTKPAEALRVTFRPLEVFEDRPGAVAAKQGGKLDPVLWCDLWRNGMFLDAAP